MRRSFLLALSVVVIGAALSGCQSDAQKMDKGLAKEYQERYQHCLKSIERFNKYAGFDFVEESGVCKCNGVECNGGDFCSPTAACEKTIIKPECTDGKICISQTIGQVCKDGHWGAPVNCKDSGEVCNTEVQGASVCAPACSNDFCTQDKDGVGSMYKCIEGGLYDEPKLCKDTDTDIIDKDKKDVSCTFNFDNNTSACGDCRNGDVQCVDDNTAKFCENGQWSNEIPNKSNKYLDCSISCEISDGPDKCYNTRTCFKEMDSGRSLVAILTESGELKEVETCTNTCKNGACVIEPEKPVECPKSCTNGCEGTTDICKEEPEPSVECQDPCPPGEACNDITGYTCKCTVGFYKCENKKIYQCNDDGWAEIAGIECSFGCTDAAPSNDISDETRLEKIYCLSSGGDKTCDNNFSCNDYMVKCQSGDDFIDINDASNVSVLKNELENLGCAYDSANNRIYCGKQSGDTIDNTDGCCDAEQTYCFGGKTYDCKSKKLEQNTNCDDKCAGKNDGTTVNCGPSCQNSCSDGEECNESTGYECQCKLGYFKCEDGYIWSCNIDHEWIKGKLDCANGCKAGVGPKSANSIGNGTTDDLKKMFCADGSDEVCDSSVYYVCKDNGRVGKCSSGADVNGCADVDDADMLMINTDNSISLCRSRQTLACDAFPDGLVNDLMRLQTKKCSGTVEAKSIQLACDCNSNITFDSWYYIYMDTGGYRSLVKFYAQYDGNGSGTCNLTISGD